MERVILRIPGMKAKDDGLKRYRQQWMRRGKSWTDLDRVMLTEPQAIALVEDVMETKYFSSDTLKRPSIPEFTAIVSEPGRQENTYICYRKTLMNADDYAIPIMEGTETSVVPLIDAYCYLNNGGTMCNCVITIGVSTLKNTKTGRVMTFSVQGATYCNDDSYTDFIFSDMDYFEEFARTVKGLYMAIQRMSLERPEILVHVGTDKVEKTETIKRKGRYKQVRKTQMVKVLRVSENVHLPCDKKTAHKITCPCWGVAGHVRTYKSGKQIWIKPYRKGKQRNNPTAYEPKEYLLPKEE